MLRDDDAQKTISTNKDNNTADIVDQFLQRLNASSKEI